MADYDSVEVPCACAEPHDSHTASLRKQLGGKAVLEVIDAAQSEGEVAGGMKAIYRALVAWDLPGPITQEAVDELHVAQIAALKSPAIKAFHEGNKPLPNASGGRSPSTSSGNRSQSRRKKD